MSHREMARLWAIILIGMPLLYVLAYAVNRGEWPEW